ncbi:hypothetical protein [Taibaiella koreensis]|uniref:hypothetical protein n=1 Tax=Taibaiella koreensis TaxID=1268548 RepID=UPI000E59D34E|nr:hypothetical protein [Taibaiella koreensis]
MKHKLKLTFGIILLTIITIISCKREEVINKPYLISTVTAQAWFEKNGGAYKSGAIREVYLHRNLSDKKIEENGYKAFCRLVAFSNRQ